MSLGVDTAHKEVKIAAQAPSSAQTTAKDYDVSKLDYPKAPTQSNSNDAVNTGRRTGPR